MRLYYRHGGISFWGGRSAEKKESGFGKESRSRIKVVTLSVDVDIFAWRSIRHNRRDDFHFPCQNLAFFPIGRMDYAYRVFCQENLRSLYFHLNPAD